MCSLSLQGVWHIPNREVDRPGSFAFHMSRCVTLLMQVLKETNDGRMLMQLSVQLGKIPESDKYIHYINSFTLKQDEYLVYTFIIIKS